MREVQQQLIGLGFDEDSVQHAKLSRAGFDWQFNDGQGAAFCFSCRDGMILRFALVPETAVSNNIVAWTIAIE